LRNRCHLADKLEHLAPNGNDEPPSVLIQAFNDIVACEGRQMKGGVSVRPKTMYPRTNFLGPKVTKMNLPGNAMICMDTSLSLCVVQYLQMSPFMTGMYQCRDIVFLGRFILGTRCPRKFVRGHID